MKTIPLSEKTLQTLFAAHQRVTAAEGQYKAALQQRGALVTVLFDALGVPPETEVNFEQGALLVPEPPAAEPAGTPAL